MKIKIAILLLITALFITSCAKEDDVITNPENAELYGGYLTYSKVQKTGNHDPIVNLQTSWQEVEVTLVAPDSIYFKVAYLPRIGFACNDIHQYELHQGTSGRTEISITNDTIYLFHLEKTGTTEAFQEETWEFEGVKTK